MSDTTTTLKNVNTDPIIKNVGFPKVVLTRIDEDSQKNKNTPLNKSELILDKNKPIKISQAKLTSPINPEKRPRGRPKKTLISNVSNTGENSKTGLKNKVQNLKRFPKAPLVQRKSLNKNVLKKSLLQKSSKVTIPTAKKPNKTVKSPGFQQKKIIEHVENISPVTKDIDSSEDEFLYDELIEELESSHNKTTNITLKPSKGNKPPTIVKGGIIKKDNLPADLKPIASLNNTSKVNDQQSFENDKNETLDKKRSKLPGLQDKTSPSKKPSPWPISISQPKSNCSSTKRKNTSIITAKPSAKIDQPCSPVNILSSEKVSKGNLAKKPKFGPKQLIISNTDDNLSDEYTEEETLENMDSYDISSVTSKDLTTTVNRNDNIFSTSTRNNSVHQENDPNLDLLRILSDDANEPVVLKSVSKSETNVNGEIKSVSPNNFYSQIDQGNSVPNIEEDPPARTIYDLMNEVSLEHPSWNLHIIPETNAFCIAQVTKGRLGLPTLKKCIELDPDNYSAKVYIHQYHIKRFDGVYDSEESILALIHEINSIKA